MEGPTSCESRVVFSPLQLSLSRRGLSLQFQCVKSSTCNPIVHALPPQRRGGGEDPSLWLCAQCWRERHTHNQRSKPFQEPSGHPRLIRGIPLGRGAVQKAPRISFGLHCSSVLQFQALIITSTSNNVFYQIYLFFQVYEAHNFVYPIFPEALMGVLP
jgi:hypothetical protein